MNCISAILLFPEAGIQNPGVPVLSSHLNAELARMGNLIREDYRSYFALDDEDNDYWVHYNQSLLQHYPIG